MPALRYSLGTLRGVPVEAHGSLLLMLGLLALRQPHLGATVAAFACLAAGVFVHEAAHAVVGARLGLRVRRIALHAFGGLSALASPPVSALDDVLVTLAGPAASLGYGSLVVGLASWCPPGWLATALRDAGLAHLYWAAFNLLPAFPMDGGRLVRRALAQGRGGLLQATLATLRTSQILLSLLGVYGLFARSFAWIALAAYLYLLGTLATPELLREAREATDSATVSPPPYARARRQRVEVTKVDAP